MDQAWQPEATKERVDWALNYLFREWGVIPAIAEEWAEWDNDSRLSYDIDFPVKESWLSILRGWADQELLDQEQFVRHQELLDLVERSRLIYDRMLAVWDADIGASRVQSERG